LKLKKFVIMRRRHLQNVRRSPSPTVWTLPVEGHPKSIPWGQQGNRGRLLRTILPPRHG
jgi:hypothetical protein